MSLIHFHQFLIATAIVFCGGFAAWEFDAGARGAGAMTFVIGTIFALLTVALVVYLKNLFRFLGYDEGESSPR